MPMAELGMPALMSRWTCASTTCAQNCRRLSVGGMGTHKGLRISTCWPFSNPKSGSPMVTHHDPCLLLSTLSWRDITRTAALDNHRSCNVVPYVSDTCTCMYTGVSRVMLYSATSYNFELWCLATHLHLPAVPLAVPLLFSFLLTATASGVYQ